MMPRNIIYIVFIVIAFFTFESCEKADIKSNHVSRGNGRWNIDKWEKIQYDSVGGKVWDSTFTDLGELNFFKAVSTNALYDYRAGVAYLKQMPDSQRVYSFEYFTDGNRFNTALKGTLTDPSKDISKFYSIEHDGFHKKVLVFVKADGNRATTAGSSQLVYKEILTITKD